MNRGWQIDMRWLQAYEHRMAAKAGRPRGDMDPERIDDRIYDMWAEMLGFQDSTPVSYTEDGIAIVSVVGPLFKTKSSPFRSNYASILEGLKELLEIPPRAVVLRIDSPGGVVDGGTAVVDAVNELAQRTLVVASVNGCGCSMAYRIASQAGSIWASKDSEVGSIGTYWQVIDYSRAYADAGLKSVLLTSGAYKGIAAPGEEITPDQQAFLQGKVDEMNARFLADVGSGRSMTSEQVAAVSDGRWWSAAEAAGLGLVDQIGSLDDVLAAIRSQQGQDTMNKQTLQPAAAGEQPAAAAAEVPVTVQEAPTQPDLAAYMTAFGDAEGARMFRDGMDFSAAQASHLQTLQGTIQDLRAELTQLKQQAASMAEAVKGETTPVAIGGTVPRSLAEAFRARKN
jgi:protease-4